MSIKNFEELIRFHIKKSSAITDCKFERLLSTGENYGSSMYKVDVIVQNENGEEETLHLVAKAAPPKCWIWELFTTVVTFKKELDFYRTIVPTMESFLEEMGLPGFLNSSAKYYGGRVTLKNDSDEVDEDAVLVFENLKSKGYAVANRFVGFNLEVAKAIVNVMAKNHAAFIAFKQARPVEFEQKLLPPIQAKFKLFLTDEAITQLVKANIITLKAVDCNLEPYEEKMNNLFKNWIVTYYEERQENIYNTFCHSDLWTNNILVKVENNNSVDVKLVDYQTTDYLPGSNDLIFFLYSSLELSYRESIGYLIDYYYERFIDSMNKLKASTESFTRSRFDETVFAASQLQLPHVLLLLPPIFTMKGKAKDLENFQPEDFKPKMEDLHENYIHRLHFIINDYIKRKWL